MKKLFLALAFLGATCAHATSPYYSLSMSTTTGITTMTITGDYEIRQATFTTVKVFRVDHNGHVQAYGGMEISTSPTASPLLWVSSTVPRVGIETTTPRNTLDVNGGLMVTSSVTADSFYGNGFGLTNISSSALNPGASNYINNTTLLQGASFYVNQGRVQNLIVDSTATVGFSVAIGTDTIFQSRRLAVVQRGANAVQTILTDPTRISALVFGDTDDDDIGGVIYDHLNENMVLRVGTTAQITLDVNAANTARISSNSGRNLTLRTPGQGDVVISADDGAAASISSIALKTSGLERLTITASGNIGISTSMPNSVGYSRALTIHGTTDAGLELAGRAISDTGIAQVAFINTASPSADKRLAVINVDRTGANNSGSLVFGTVNGGAVGTRMTIDPDGAPTDGALCLNSSKVLSKCTSAVDASGNCTCP